MQLIVSPEQPPKSEEVQGFDRVFIFSFVAFPQLFGVANHDEVLLRELSLFPIYFFIDTTFRSFRLYQYLPLLFEWIYEQVRNLLLNRVKDFHHFLQDIELYREYTSRYDNYLRVKLSIWVDAHRKHTAQFAVLTALTLKVKHDSRSTVYFFQRKIPESRGYMVPTFPLTLRADFFARAGYYDLSGTDDCISRLVRIVAEPDKSGHRWIDTSEPYVKLAMVILEIFQTRWVICAVQFVS